MIEPQLASIRYNEELEAEVSVVIKKLKDLLDDYVISGSDKEEVVKQELKQIFKTHKEFVSQLQAFEGDISLNDLEELISDSGINLSQIAKSYCIYIMYKNDNNLERLRCGPLICLIKGEIYEEEKDNEVLNELNNAYKKSPKQKDSEELQEEVKESNKKHNEGEAQYFNLQSVPKKESEQKGEPEIEPLNAEVPLDNVNELTDKQDELKPLNEELTEEQIIRITEECFQEISQYMINAGFTIDSRFKDMIRKETINNEEFEIITVEDFFNEIDSMPITKLTEEQKLCLIQVLTMNDNEDFIEVNDLVQVFDNYGVINKKAPRMSSRKVLPRKSEKRVERPKEFEQLDKVSMVLMLALAEYLLKAEISMCDLFDTYIYTRTTGQGEVEVLHPKDFFKVLCEISIKTDESVHENLKDFLALGSDDMLSVEKLKDALTKFATNKDLRAVAHEYYVELISEDNDDESVY